MNKTYIKIFSLLSKKIGAALLTSIVFGILYAFAFITPASERQPNVYYFDLSEILFFVVLYTVPVYILLAIPFSIFVDKSRLTKSLSYFKKIALFSLAGAIAGAILILLFIDFTYDEWLTTMLFALYGLISANLFLLFSTLLEKIIK